MKRQQKIGVLSALVALTVGSFGVSQMAQATEYIAGDTITIDSNNVINVKNMTMKESDKSLAVGYNNTLSGVDSVVIGTKNTVKNSDSATVGYDNLNYGFSSAILGHGNFTIGEYSAAIGFSNGAGGNQSSAVGYSNVANGANSSAFGRNNGVYGVSTSAVGDSNDVYGANSAAFGKENTVGHGDYDDDLKFVIDDKGNNSYVVGASNQVMANKAFVFGAGNQIGDVTQEGAEAQDANVFVLGSNNNFTAQNAIVIGSGVTTVAANSVVIGNGSTSEDANTVSVGTTGSERKIVHVKAGTANTDAATFGQLIKAGNYEIKSSDANTVQAVELDYNDGTSGSAKVKISIAGEGKVASGDKRLVDGATVYDAIAKSLAESAYTGSDTITIKEKEIRVTNMAMGSSEGEGTGATATGSESFAIGNEAKATGKGSVALGNGAEAGGTAVENEEEINGATVAVGAVAKAYGNYSTALGCLAETTSDGYMAVAIGTMAKVSGDSAIAIGAYTEAGGQETVAVGYNVTTSKTSGETTTAAAGATGIGSRSEASALLASAFGYGSAASGEIAVAAGAYSVSQGEGSIAVGYKAQANDNGAVVLGSYSQAYANSSMALGVSSYALGTASSAMGPASRTYQGAGYSTAVGTYAEAQASYAVAIGYEAVAKTANTVSFGHAKGDSYMGVNEKNEYESMTYKTDSFATLTNVKPGEHAHEAATWDQLVKNDQTYELKVGEETEIKNNANETAFKLKLNLENGAVTSKNSGYVTGGEMYTELRPAKGNYISQKGTTAENLTALDGQVKTNADNIGILKTDVSGLKTDVSGMKTDVSGLKTDVSGLKTDVSALKSDVSGLGDRVTGVENTLAGIDDKIAATKVDGSSIVLSKDNNTATVNHVDGTKAFSITIEGLDEDVAYEAGNGINISEDNQISVKVDGDDLTLSENGLGVKKDGKVESANTGIVTGGAVYDAISARAGDTTKLSAAGLGDNLTDSVLTVNDKIGGLSVDINKVGAGAAALAALHPEGYDPADKWSFAVGYGHYKNANAGALGAFFKPNADTTLSVGGTIGNGDAMMNAGVSFKLGSRSDKIAYHNEGAVLQELASLRKNNDRLTEQNAVQQKEILALRENNERMQKQIEMILSQMRMSGRVARSVR